jgi:hypothetical protein
MSCPKTAVLDEPEFGRFVFYKLLTAIPVAAALIAMFRYSEALYWPFIYVGLCLLHAGIMYTIKCPHCAYYKKGGKTHHCFMIWGAPKIWKPRSGPESRIVGIYAPIGMAGPDVLPPVLAGVPMGAAAHLPALHRGPRHVVRTARLSPVPQLRVWAQYRTRRGEEGILGIGGSGLIRPPPGCGGRR